MVYSTDCSKVVVPVLVLLFVALWFIDTRQFVLNLALCYFVLVFFSLFSLGKRQLIFSAFCTFVRFALVWFCLFPLPLCVWDRLRLVILALPGLFSYLFLNCLKTKWANLPPTGLSRCGKIGSGKCWLSELGMFREGELLCVATPFRKFFP